MEHYAFEKAWQGLDLSILEPAHLSRGDLIDIRDSFHDPAWRDKLPLKVASATAQFSRRVTAEACRSSRENPAGPVIAPEVARLFSQDIIKINNFFFGVGIQKVDARMGSFNRDPGDEDNQKDGNRDARIHADCFGDRSLPMYLLRINALPFGYIRGVELQSLTREREDLVRLALEQDMRSELRHVGLLHDAALGDIMLMSTRAGAQMATPDRWFQSGYGTLHARGTIPSEPEGRISALIRAVSCPYTPS